MALRAAYQDRKLDNFKVDSPTVTFLGLSQPHCEQSGTSLLSLSPKRVGAYKEKAIGKPSALRGSKLLGLCLAVVHRLAVNCARIAIRNIVAPESRVGRSWLIA